MFALAVGSYACGLRVGEGTVETGGYYPGRALRDSGECDVVC